jgi:hypothetical protein
VVPAALPQEAQKLGELKLAVLVEQPVEQVDY